MTIERFNTLEDQLGFVNEAISAGVRVKIRSGLEVEVPDGYERGKTSEQLTAEAEVEPEPEPEAEATPEPEPVAEVAEPEPDEPTKPNKTDDKPTWETYARSLGIDIEGMTKAEIIKAIETKE